MPAFGWYEVVIDRPRESYLNVLLTLGFPGVLHGGSDSRTLPASPVDLSILSSIPTETIVTDKIVCRAAFFGVGDSLFDGLAIFLQQFGEVALRFRVEGDEAE